MLNHVAPSRLGRWLMGAKNAKLAFGLWAGKVPNGSLAALVFMALTSKDADSPALFWGGYESIALSALGRKGPYSDADERAVGRVVGPLLKAGAIAVHKASAPGRHVCYVLNLDGIAGRETSCE